MPEAKLFYQLTAKEAADYYNGSLKGLNAAQVALQQQQFGKNILTETPGASRWMILLSQFKDVMVIILLIAALVSFLFGEHTDAYVILAIIAGNAWMGYSQEYKTAESIRLLQKMVPQFAVALRNNLPLQLKASELVPGDVILLEAGNLVPADARLIRVHGFKTDEASLTGESESVHKIVTAIDGKNLVPGDQHNMVFKGTHVSKGSATALVTATGMQTELGKIASLLKVKEQRTPLQKRLAVFSRQLAIVIILICIAVFAAGIWQGAPVFLMFLTALSLAVAALPEALPAVITIALSRGANRMVKQKALMRNLPAVETLGSVTYICCDKTGTLTQNDMTVEKIQSVPGKENLLMHAMLLSNEVKFSGKDLLGDATELALVDSALNKGFIKSVADEEFPLVAKLPFDSVRMRMSTLHKHGGKWILFVKGAPITICEVISERYKDDMQPWLDQNSAWAAEGLRVLFLGYKILEQDPGVISTGIENNLEFLGIAAMIDPPRDEVVPAIEECITAGIKIVMITGDQPATAAAIAHRLGLANDREHTIKTGADLETMSPDELRRIVKNTSVYARVSPKQKLTIVAALQDNGEFVAMTGDGVNDAPSLKRSDIGIAMGITGTDVSKDAADMILLDDNFATIVKAVREGRKIYDNIRKFILYILSCNLGELLTIVAASLAGFAIPLLPIHILWINLVTDGLPGLALVTEPAEKNIMNRPPRPPKESLFAGGLVFKIVWTGIMIGAAAFAIQWWAITKGCDVRTQQTVIFTTLCFVQLGNALSVRFVQHAVLSRGLFLNKAILATIAGTVLLQLAIVYVPFLQRLLKTSSLNGDEMTAILVVTFLAVTSIDLLKYIRKDKQGATIKRNFKSDNNTFCAAL